MSTEMSTENRIPEWFGCAGTFGIIQSHLGRDTSHCPGVLQALSNLDTPRDEGILWESHPSPSSPPELFPGEFGMLQAGNSRLCRVKHSGVFVAGFYFFSRRGSCAIC